MNATKPGEYGSDGDAPELVAIYWETMTELTNIRIALLRVYSGKGVSKGITGVYTDSYGGVMKLQQTKAGVVFFINVDRCPTVEKSAESDRSRVTISFTKNASILEMTTANRAK